MTVKRNVTLRVCDCCEFGVMNLSKREARLVKKWERIGWWPKQPSPWKLARR